MLNKYLKMLEFVLWLNRLELSKKKNLFVFCFFAFFLNFLINYKYLTFLNLKKNKSKKNFIT